MWSLPNMATNTGHNHWNRFRTEILLSDGTYTRNRSWATVEKGTHASCMFFRTEKYSNFCVSCSWLGMALGCLPNERRLRFLGFAVSSIWLIRAVCCPHRPQRFRCDALWIWTVVRPKPALKLWFCPLRPESMPFGSLTCIIPFLRYAHSIATSTLRPSRRTNGNSEMDLNLIMVVQAIL